MSRLAPTVQERFPVGARVEFIDDAGAHQVAHVHDHWLGDVVLERARDPPLEPQFWIVGRERVLRVLEAA